MMKVLVSSHQNLLDVSEVRGFRLCNLPFGARILAHGVSDRVHLFPAFPPFVSIALLGAHVYYLQVVSPFVGILLFVLDTISLDGPFAGTFPLHDTTALVRGENDDVLTTSTEP